MLTIRNEQTQAFQKINPAAFESEMLSHIARHFPKHFDWLGAGSIREVVTRGYEAAIQCGFSTRHQARLYVDLRIMLGSGFDTDPQMPWASETLAGVSTAEADERIHILYARACRYLDAVVGPDRVFPVPALRRMKAYRFEDLAKRPAGDEDAVLLEFERIWPKKCGCVSREHLRELIRRLSPVAANYGLGGAGVDYYLILAFTLGHKFDEDPAFRSITERFVSGSGETRQDSFRRLYDLTQEALTQAMGAA